jgi:small subunit ribosomal protein S9
MTSNTKVTRTKKEYTYAVGRRRTAAARVRLFRGKGETTVNGLPIAKYFEGEIKKDIWAKPFRVIDGMDKFYATVKVQGGGVNGRVEAVAHAVAKALAKLDRENFRRLLKKAGLLTSDSRGRERRKVGTGGRARKQKQSPKR